MLEYANQIIGPALERLNGDELYILMCAAYTHDFGMSVGEKTFHAMKRGIVTEDFFEKHPELTVADALHHQTEPH